MYDTRVFERSFIGEPLPTTFNLFTRGREFWGVLPPTPSQKNGQFSAPRVKMELPRKPRDTNVECFFRDLKEPI